MKKIAVVLSGCGVFDGSEIHEAVLTLLAILKHNASYQCFAPDAEQLHVVNHLTGDVTEEKRNMLVEAARIARGDIKPLTQLSADEFDAIVFPGGFGAAKNLCDFALQGAQATLHPDVLNAAKAFANQHKPAGFICIAPAMIPLIYGPGVKGTIGNDQATAEQVTQMGLNHVNCAVDDIVIDDEHVVISTPAYMLANTMLEASQGIEKLIAALIERCH
jgi:enhancing lycopene biosynthesis protein 2